MWAVAGWADVVQLDDGRKIEGLVIGESPVDVTIKLDTGAVISLPRQRVRSITRPDWQYYVQKGDTAPSGAEALQFYQTARKINPRAPGLDEKIRSATALAGEEAKQRVGQAERSRREAEEDEILNRYNTLMEATRRDAARDLLEQAIAEKPWLRRSRLLLADFYARDRAPDKRARYVAALGGLIRNDPAAYFASHAPLVVDAAQRALLDGSAGVIPADVKERLIAGAAPFAGEDGNVMSLDEYQRRGAERASSGPLALAKIEFLKNACLKRTGTDTGIDLDVTTFIGYANQLSAVEKQSLLRPKLEQWSKQAQQLLDSKDATKGAILADVILTFDPQNSNGKAVAAKSRAQEARRLRERTQFDRARKVIEAAEKAVPNDPGIAAEKAMLFATLARAQGDAGNLEEAVNTIAAAVAARSTDAEAAKMVGAEQNRVYDTLLKQADTLAKQGNPGAAIDVVQLALKAKSDIMTKMKANSLIDNYRTRLRDIARAQIKGAAENHTFSDLVLAMAMAQKYGAWDNQMTSETLRAVRTTKRAAQDAAGKKDAFEAFMVAGRLAPWLAINPDAKIGDLLKTARDTVVGGGQLTLPNFFAGAWVGKDVQWVLQETESHFNGSGFKADATGLTQNARAEHGEGDQYVIRIDRTDANDSVSVRVLDPDNLMIERYSSKPTDTAKNETTMNYNAPIRRVPTPKAAPGRGRRGGGPGGEEATTGTKPSDQQS
jgi:tetratricopeptide (TPR) repeat protein